MGSGLRRRAKKLLAMRESQDLDMDLSRTRDLTGRRIRISVKRSESAATLSAAHDNDDAYSAMEDVGGLIPP